MDPVDLTYEQKSYIKLIGDRSVAWSAIYCPAIQDMINNGLLELSNHDATGVYNSRITVSKLGMKLYEKESPSCVQK